MTSCASHAAPTRPPRPASTSREPGALVGRHDVIAQTPALRRRLLEQRDGWRAAGVSTSAPGARAGRLERARPRRSHLWQAGAARCHVRGARRSSEPTSWERSDGHGWQRWFQSGGASAAQQSARLCRRQGARQARRRCRSSAPRLAVVLRLVAAFVVVIVHVQPLVRVRARAHGVHAPSGLIISRRQYRLVLRVSPPVAGGLTGLHVDREPPFVQRLPTGRWAPLIGAVPVAVKSALASANRV
jgi:hypothetical protein